MKKNQLCLLLIIIAHVLPAQTRYSVIIDEIMADPSPAVGLPNYEWIELKNISGIPISLQNWRVGDGSGQSGPIPAFMLQPDSFVVICGITALPLLSGFGTAVAVTSFPSLDNDGELLFLKAANGTIVHTVNYSSSWYDNALKKEGGWTLEMTDTQNPCFGNGNWKASTAIQGGTPGKKNAVDAINRDTIGPKPANAYTINDTTIIIVFNEPVDSISGSMITHYSISDGLIITGVLVQPPLFNQVEVKFNPRLLTDTIYTIIARMVTDCQGNLSQSDTLKTGLPVAAVSGEIVINEVLANPRPNAFDYLELYNNGERIVDAASLFIADRNSSAVISSIKPLSTTPRYIFPGDYIVVTENPDNLSLNYLVKYPARVLSVSPLPSFPDKEGDIVLLNFQGAIIDEVNYSEEWHFKLLNNHEGVSLERIDPKGLSNDPANWHSAASTAGYGTPGYKNSQFKNPAAINASIIITPTVFSPDNDGHDDIATIQYKMEEAGFVANVNIFDANGRIVKNLARNALLGNTGYWNWDGLDDRGRTLPVGTYIILTEIFNLHGRKNMFKNTVVLARYLR